MPVKNDNLLILFAKNNLFRPEARSSDREKSGWISRFFLINGYHHPQGICYDKAICLTNGSVIDETWKEAGFWQMKLHGGDLGERLYDAFSGAFRNHYKKVVILAGNYGATEISLVKGAFNSLTENEIVIGPDNAGGYYLLGMKQMMNHLFINKQWNGHAVLKDTIRDILLSGKSFHMIEPFDGSKHEPDTIQQDQPETVMSVSR